MNRRHRPATAILGALAASAVLFPIGPASAQEAESEDLRFTYGVDTSAWYWVHQRDEEIAAGPLTRRQELPHGQDESTLPVAVESGEPSKASALRFNLVERGVPDGATVTRFVLTIVEGTEPGEAPTVNPAENELQACGAADAWSPGEGDLWDAKPETTGDCVTGVREEIEPQDEEIEPQDEEIEPQDEEIEPQDEEIEPQDEETEPGDEAITATWTFDLTSLATDWGEDSLANHGVVLGPVVAEDAEPTDSWQVNLKLPLRNDPSTPIDEYEESADRVVVDLAYVPAEPPPEESEDAEPTPEATPTEEPVGDEAVSAPPADDIAGGSSGGVDDLLSDAPTGDDEPEVEEAVVVDDEQEEQAVPVASNDPFEPAMPWYAWLLIPALLLVTMLVRGALVEAVPSTRPNGVIELIRRRNSLRRGTSLPVRQSRMSRLIVALSSGRGARST